MHLMPMVAKYPVLDIESFYLKFSYWPAHWQQCTQVYFYYLCLILLRLYVPFPIRRRHTTFTRKKNRKKVFKKKNMPVHPAIHMHSRKEERCDGYECTYLISQGSKTATALYCTDTADYICLIFLRLCLRYPIPTQDITRQAQSDSNRALWTTRTTNIVRVFPEPIC